MTEINIKDTALRNTPKTGMALVALGTALVYPQESFASSNLETPAPTPIKALASPKQPPANFVTIDSLTSARSPAHSAIQVNSNESSSVLTKPGATQTDQFLDALQAQVPELDKNKNGRISIHEIHGFVCNSLEEMLKGSSLNQGDSENPKYSFFANSALNHLRDRSSYILPILEEQRIFNKFMRSYNSALDAFQILCPKGFSKEIVLCALDGADGTPKDGSVSESELQTFSKAHPQKRIELERLAITMFSSSLDGIAQTVDLLLKRDGSGPNTGKIMGEEQRAYACFFKEFTKHAKSVLQAPNKSEAEARYSKLETFLSDQVPALP